MEAMQTNQLIIVGVYGEEMHRGNAAGAVERLGGYLRDNGY